MNEMKIVYNRFIPFRGFKAINLFGILFVRREFEGKLKQRDIRHEYIHSLQQKELWYIGFFILYVWYWLKGLFMFKGGKGAYLAIPFECEAKYGQSKPTYPKYRPKHAWRDFKGI